MEANRRAGDMARIMEFLKSKRPEETPRDAVIRYYMELGASSGITATQDVGVIVNGVEIGTVDCALAAPASMAIIYAEDKLGALLGLWILAEFSPKTGVLALNSQEASLVSDIASIIRRSYLLRFSPVRFLVLDVVGGRRDIIQRRGAPGRRKKIIKGRRPAYKKQD